MRFSLVLGAVLLLFTGSVFSKSSNVIQLDLTKGNFSGQQDAIVQAINIDVDYSEISATDRALVHQSLGKIADMLKDGKSFTSVSNEDQQLMLTVQKVLNDALIQAKKDSRMICKMEPTLGSNFDKKVCRTAASLKRENEDVRNATASGRTNIN